MEAPYETISLALHGVTRITRESEVFRVELGPATRRDLIRIEAANGTVLMLRLFAPGTDAIPFEDLGTTTDERTT